MCIICVKPEGKSLAENVIQNMWSVNSDGAGFMYAEDGVLHVQKGFMTLSEFKEAYEPHKLKQAVLHFRIKTHGEKNPENTHPFYIDENLAFVHNGIIQGFGSNSHSDTWHFNEEIIKPIRSELPNFLDIKPITQLIQDKISYSKLVFLNSEGEITIINKDKGVYSSDGFWFSNNSWEDRESYIPAHWHKKKDSANDNFGNNDNATHNSNSTGTQPSSPKSIKMDDLVYLKHAYKDIPMGTIGVVSWFTGGYAYAVTIEEKTEYIPISLLEKVIPIRMTRTVGHLRPGDPLSFLEKNHSATRAYDPARKKIYHLPISSWEIIPEKEVNRLSFVPATDLYSDLMYQ